MVQYTGGRKRPEFNSGSVTFWIPYGEPVTDIQVGVCWLHCLTSAYSLDQEVDDRDSAVWEEVKICKQSAISLLQH